MQKKLFSTILILILIIPLLFMNHKKSFASDLDNRYLTEISITKDIDKLTNNISLYIQDRIGFRHISAKIFSWINDKMFNYITNPLYEYGNDGYIFAKNQGTSIDKLYMKSFVDFLSKLDQYTKNRNINFYFMLNPTKTRIMIDYVKNERILDFPKENYLFNELANLPIKFINSEISLSNSPYPSFNKKYDPNHWNNFGAFVATNQLLDTIKIDYPSIELNNISDYSLSIINEEFLPESVFKINEDVNYLNLKSYYSINHISLDNEIEVDPNFHYVTYSINEKANNSVRALVFRGSYYITDSMEDKFISPAFSETLFVHNYSNILNYEYYINLFQPDIVIFETVEYTLEEYFFSQYAMDNKELEISSPLKLRIDLDKSSIDVLNNQLKKTDVLEITKLNHINKIEFYLNKETTYNKIIGYIGNSRLDFYIEDLGDHFRVYSFILDSLIDDDVMSINFINEKNTVISKLDINISNP